MNNTELKNLIDDNEFIENMNKAFSDLRADYELTMDTTLEKINELKELHVDVNNQLSDLTSLARKSSGTISGLRGTGKTHLMLLARHELNLNLWNNQDSNNICIYLNMKRLCLPEEFDEDMFNRVFSIFIYEELSAQLLILLKRFEDETFLKKILGVFNNKDKNIKKDIKKAIACIFTMKEVAREGNEQIRNIGKGELIKEESQRELDQFVSKINAAFKSVNVDMNLHFEECELEEITSAVKDNNAYLQYLNIKSVRDKLLEIISLLDLDSITFFVDEWEKISQINNCQEYTARYIDRIIDDPIFFWLGIVPYRGGLYCLDNGADLQHQINLDESLIFEGSSQERLLCINYFKQIVNKRLNHYLKDEKFNYKLMFNSEENFSLLVMASMGNTRDFGTMLLKCWSEFQTYRKSPLTPGRPFKYISQQMINSAIKDNGDKKYSNIENDDSTVIVWNDIKNYCINKKSSHFAIEEKTESFNSLREKEFSELIYHRLLHLRKMHVPAKDAEIENKLSIYAINYAATYSLHSQDKKMSFITEYKTIHDRVRRYIYNPQKIINQIKINSGEIFPCASCGENINPKKMKYAWEKNACPFCGGNIYSDS